MIDLTKEPIQITEEELKIADIVKQIEIIPQTPSTIELSEKDLPPESESDLIVIGEGWLKTPEELERDIEIFLEDTTQAAQDGVIDLTDISQIMERYGSDFAPKALVSAATNRITGEAFCRRVRTNLNSILPWENSPGMDQEFNSSSLIHLAEKWSIPFYGFRLGSDPKYGGHFCLALQNPVKEDNKWKVLLYDPMGNGERWLDLPDNWDTNFYSGALGIRTALWNQSSQDLTLKGDLELAQNWELVKAKSQRFQAIGDVINCGPLIVYAAALRAGMQPGETSFKNSGRFKLEEDTRTVDSDGTVLPGIKIYTYEEIRDGKEWGQDYLDSIQSINILD